MSEDILYSTVSAASEWPHEVAHIAKFLTDAVPSGLLSSSPRLSGVTAPLWHDMVRTRCAATGSADISTPVSDEVIGMIERLLYSVAILQSLKASGSTVRELRPAVSLLFHALGDTCLPQLKISGERPFALSRYNGQGGTVGQVFKLLSAMSTHQGEEEETHAGDNEPVDPSANSFAYSMTDDSNSETTDSSLSESPRPLADLTLQRHPADTHFLDSWHDQRSWLCPFICVADAPHIREAMISAACQRFNWSISEPVVGLALMDDGTSIEIHFAWAKPSPRMSNVPFIHVVSSLGSDTSMGAYDLSDSLSTLLFAQFLLSLRSAADAFSNICHNSQYLNVNWRADSAIEDASVAPYTSGTMVNQWIHQVEPSSGDFAEKDTKPSSPSASTASLASLHPSSFVMTDSSARETRSTSRSQPSGHSQKALSVVSSNGGNSAVTRKSASDLCHTVEMGVSHREVSIGSFMHDRDVIEVACMELNIVDPTQQKAGQEMDQATLQAARAAVQAVNEINGMTEIYNQLTNYVPFPKGLLDHDEASTTDYDSNPEQKVLTRSELDELRTELFNQVRQFERKTIPKVTNPPGLLDENEASTRTELLNQVHELERDDEVSNKQNEEHPMAAVLSVSLSSMLATVQMARNAQAEGANEAEARHGWDLLTSVTFVAGKELTSPRLKLERMLPLSRNTLFDRLKSNEPLKLVLEANAMLDLQLTSYTVSQAFSWPAYRLYQLPDATALAARRLADATTFHQPTIVRHAKQEAFRAICDSFLGFPALVDSPVHVPEPFLRMDVDKSEPRSGILPDIPEDSSTDKRADQGKGKARKQLASEVNPYITTTTETRRTGGHVSGLTLALLGQLVLPVFLGEYKKDSQEYRVALRQLKLYLISSVAFLASLDIKKCPVFGLATNGAVGVVLCAWRSEVSQYTYIMDRNVRSFDLTSPIEMYQFATFMARLRKQSDTKLADLVKEHIGDFKQYRDEFQQKTWTKNAQLDQYPEIKAKTRGAKNL